MTDSPRPNLSTPSTPARVAVHSSRSHDDPSAGLDSFLAAWIHGVTLAGPHLFHRRPQGAQNNIPRKDLRPDIPLIQRAIGPMSPAERFFLAALVSFYNADEGGLLLKRSGFQGFSDFGRLDLARRTVLAALLVHLDARSDFRISDQLPALDALTGATGDQSLWDSIAREERHFDVAPEVFLSVWKRGVAFAGAHLFGEGPEADLELSTTKWDLCPKVRVISRALRRLPPLEQLFLATLVSFYNDRDGGRLLKRTGFRGLLDFAPLDTPHRAVLAGLILNYTGW
jgi:hypothetical protein